MTNLQYFEAELEALPLEERASVRNYMFGILTVGPSREDFAKDVQLALQCHRNVQEYIKAQQEATPCA